MKIAVTSTGTDLDSQVDPRFGRAAYILIIDSDTLDFDVLDNKENVNGFKAMNAAKIEVANDAEGTVREAVQAYLDGKMPLADEANVEGHW